MASGGGRRRSASRAAHQETSRRLLRLCSAASVLCLPTAQPRYRTANCSATRGRRPGRARALVDTSRGVIIAPSDSARIRLLGLAAAAAALSFWRCGRSSAVLESQTRRRSGRAIKVISRNPEQSRATRKRVLTPTATPWTPPRPHTHGGARAKSPPTFWAKGRGENIHSDQADRRSSLQLTINALNATEILDVSTPSQGQGGDVFIRTCRRTHRRTHGHRGHKRPF